MQTQINGFKLSPQQKRLWLLQKSSQVYQAYCTISLTGELKKAVLQQALAKLVERHEIFRTHFQKVQGLKIPLQVVNDSILLSFSEYDLTNHENLQVELDKLLQSKRQEIDWQQTAILQAILIAITPQKHLLSISLPALYADRVSLNNLVRELSQCYTACLFKQDLVDQPLQYADIAEWQNELLETEAGAIDFWQQLDPSVLKTANLPWSKPSIINSEFQPQWLSVAIAPDMVAKIDAISQSQKLADYGFLLTCFIVLLGRLTKQSNLMIGVAGDGRNYEDLQPSLGLLAKYLPLDIHLQDDEQFYDIWRRVQQQTEEILELQESFCWDKNKEFAENSLEPLFFPLCFEFESILNQYFADNICFAIEQKYACIDRFQVKLVCVRRGAEITAEFHYDANLFAVEDMQRLASQFQTLIASVLQNPEKKSAGFDILSQSERSQLLLEFNNTQTAKPKYECVHHWFESQVESTPDNIAVVCANQQLTYTQLNHKANQLAHHLQQLGVGPEVLVGICVERSLDLVVGVLGILKAGGAYVPIDPTYPKERLAFILQDTQAPVLLTQQSLLAILPQHDAEVICLDRDWTSTPTLSNPTSQTNSENLAYVIYTSGSTGKPKGTLIPHKGLVNYLSWCTQAYQVSQGNGTIVHSPLGFDLTITSLFSPLLVGSQVELLPENHHIESLSNALHRSSHLSLVKITPAHLELLKGQFSPSAAAGRTRAFIIGGENLLAENISFWQKAAPDTILINEYGPTETVVGCCVYQVPPGQSLSGSIPIGKPIANTQLYVLDQYGQPTPIGVVGELHIGGVGLARGYLHRPDLSAEKFIPNPFSTEPGERLYKTGDLARYRLDGTLEYLGRIDDQVKIRGFRIELGEIEAVLAQAPGVKDAVVIVREDIPANKRLVAYIVYKQESPTTVHQLQVFLQQKLPDYMIPAAFVSLQNLPLTANGKVSRRALPAPEQVNTKTYVAPRTPVEETLAKIWTQILRLEQVGIHDNFLQVGGDSILSIQVIAKAKQAGLQLTPQQIFDHPTIAELATVVGSNVTIEAEQGLITGKLPLTPIQHWFFEQNLPEPHYWNQAVLLQVNQPLDAVLLQQALQHLLKHHDALRLQFKCCESGWQQVNASTDWAIALTIEDLSKRSPQEQQLAIELTATQLQASLNLSPGPLVQVALFNLGQQQSRVLIVIHHLAVDGVSWRILLEDLQTSYQQLQQGQNINLPAKTTAFKYWAEKLSEYANSAALQQELSYWLALPQQPPKITVDFPKGINTEASKATVSRTLSVAETQALLQQFPLAYRTQINDVLLTALLYSFQQNTGQSSLLLDLEGHGREDIFEDVDLSRTVGWLTTIFPVLLDISNAADLIEAVQQIKEQLRSIPHRGLGYGILRYLNHQLPAQPQPEVIFNYLGQFDQILPNLTLFSPATESIGPTHSPRGKRRHLLEVEGMVINGQLQLQWFYSRNLHRQETVEQLAEGMVAGLRSLLATQMISQVCQVLPGELPIAEPTNRHRPDKLPLSFAQERLWFLAQLQPDSSTYNELFALRLMGLLNVEVLEQSLNEIVRRHEVLRTSFYQDNGQPFQAIASNIKLKLPIIDLKHLSASEQATAVERLMIQASQTPFDLEQGPLLRCTLIHTHTQEYIVLFSIHHIASDGWSMGVLVEELATLYAAFTAGESSPLPELPMQYVDFAIWQRQYLQGERRETLLTYWKQQLANLPVLQLPTTRPRTEVTTNQGASYGFVIPASVVKQVRSLSQQAGVTLFMTLLASFKILLQRYCQQDDIVVGTDVANRNHAEIQPLIGFFINLLVLRTDLSGNPTFLELLQRIRSQTLRAYAHQDLPFDELVRALQPERHLSNTVPLFQVLFVFQNTPQSSLELPGISFQLLEVESQTSRFDLSLLLQETEQGLKGKWQYNADLFSSNTIIQLTNHWQTLINNIVHQPQSRINSLEMLTESEKTQQTQQQQNKKVAKRQKFMTVAPQPVSLSVEQLIKTDYFPETPKFPLIIQPNSPEVDLISWAANNRDYLNTQLCQHGAILFRDFQIKSVPEFENFAQTICPNLFAEYGDLPRTGEGGKVYGSTPYPADKAILFHNESSHLHSFPLKIWFYCVQPAAQGGETPIVDCRQAYQLLSPKLKEILTTKQLMYVRNYTDGLDVSWQDFFHTNDKSVVETYCIQNKIDFEWYDNNSLITRQIRPALLTHPQTGEPVFFNQIQLHHISYLDPEVRESLLSAFGENKLPRNVYYGDGTPIEASVIAEINEIYRQCSTSFSWQQQDILMLDNILVAHARNPYVGSRKIVVALGEIIRN
ncbi:non-ribosomal peptide synthetase [Nostoc sp. FACHB-110]|uniref:non-ribosomal peptide synthetase n=1 Tax=Nostoc sp. FACHB-110 TaxID=2692834 RepID=UPI001F54D753|nr:non-ribosomal peptide synthetase [Nostoc sp. FACHB-110]